MSATSEFPVSRVTVFCLATATPFRRNALVFSVITLFSIFYQTRWGTVPDTSWLITVCERVLSGERLYTEVLETNPPFTIWLYLPPVALARQLGIDPEILVHAWTYLAVIVGLGFAGWTASNAAFDEYDGLVKLAPAIYAMLVIYPGNAFTEREHIGMALFLPLLVLIAWRARPGRPKPGIGIAVVAGLCGSILLLIKPYYALMVLFPALFAARRQRSLRPILALEMWIIGLICTFYLTAIFYLYPEYINTVLPLLGDSYAKIRTFFPIVIKFGLPWLFLMFLAWRLWPDHRGNELATVSILASVAGMISLFYQAKGWAYHAYPAMLCAIIAIICLLALPAVARRADGCKGFAPMFMAPKTLIVLCAIAITYIPFLITQKPSAEIIEALRAATVRPTVAQIGSDLAIGHPLNRMVGGRWVSANLSDWIGTFSYLLAGRAQLDGDEAEVRRYVAIMDRYSTEKRAEFLRARPDILLVQRKEAGWTDLLKTRYGFEAIMSDYHLIAQDRKMQVYLRNDYTAPTRPN